MLVVLFPNNLYPHLLRHTMAQYLADQGMPENLLQNIAEAALYVEPDRQVARGSGSFMCSRIRLDTVDSYR